MQSVSIIGKRVFLVSLLWSALVINALAQDNSPWSRYGLGDIVPSGNIANRGMGSISAAYGDFQTINFINPASYSKFGPQRAILDIGLDINNRRLSNNKGNTYSSNNAYIPYLASGFQIKPQKAKYNWGLAFGLRPLNKVSYNIQGGSRITAGDSVQTIYEGTGGTYQAFLGTGIGIKNLSFGINSGYRFGSTNYTTRVSIYNDTVPDRYRLGKKEIKNNFGAPFIDLGIQYMIKIKKDTANRKISSLQLGAYTILQSKMKAKRDEVYESFFVSDEAGTEKRLDSVSEIKNIKGNAIYPSTYGFGLMYENEGKSSVRIGADLELSNWGQYRYFGNKDLVQNIWQLKVGGQFMPDIRGADKSYWNQVIYRAGFHYGTEPYTIGGELNNFGITFGVGLPIKRYSFSELNRNNIINTSFEFGQRGNRSSLLRENYIRFAVGFSLSDIWFIKRKYD
jgi:hypothetical protein